MNDLVSIIMPSYNTGKYIRDSIQSVLQQTYPDWELIVVDDCSTDQTMDIIAGFEDPRIRIFQNDRNRGAAYSRNKALNLAKGKWIAFLDSDDLWHPQKLEKQIQFMKDNGYLFTFTDYQICLNGKWLPYINTGPDVVTKKKMYDYCYFSTITVMYERETIGTIQIADLKKNNDYAMWLQTIEKANAYRLPECLSYYIKHDDSISSGSKWKLIKWHYLLFRKGMNKGRISALFHTFNNLAHGVWKKYRYKRPVE